MDKVLEIIEQELIAHANDDKAPRMAHYMKDHFEYYGVQSPARKDILKLVRPFANQLDINQLLELTDRLWKKPQREYQYVALDLLAWKKRHLTQDHLPKLESLITTKSWWDSVDAIAPNLVGGVLQNDKAVQYKWVEKWIASENMWLRRSAIIHQLRYKAHADQELLFALVESQIGSKEFFINKACGWALRQHSKFYPQEVKSFIDMHSDLSGLTKREGSKYI